MKLEQTGNAVIHCMFDNGWTHDHHVSNVYVYLFAPSGEVIACALNAPEDAFSRCGGIVFVDSASRKAHFPFLCKSSQDYVIITEDFGAISGHRQATSFRQASEYGMHGLQWSFMRLKGQFAHK